MTIMTYMYRTKVSRSLGLCATVRLYVRRSRPVDRGHLSGGPRTKLIFLILHKMPWCVGGTIFSGCPRRFHDNSSTDISSTTLRLQTFRLQTFRLQTFRLLLYTSVQDSYTSNFCFGKSLFSSNPTSIYTMIPFYQSRFH